MSKAKSEQVSEDVLPDVDDDQVEMFSEREADIKQDDSEEDFFEEQESDEEAEEDLDPRALIAKKYRENRDREKSSEEAKSNPPVDTATEEESESDSGSSDEDLEENAELSTQKGNEGQKSAKGAEQQDPEILMIIDGKEVKKPLSEVRALAQMGLAGENRLEEAKRLLKEAQALRHSAPNSEHQRDDAEEQETHLSESQKGKEAPENQPKASLDPEKLKSIVERVQIGDAEDGVQALVDYGQELLAWATAQQKQPELDAEAIGKIVQNYTVQTQTRDEIQSALRKFADEYPDLAKDEVLADAGRTVLRNELIADLKSAGASDEDIKPIAHDASALAHAQRVLRSNGHKVRTYGELLESVGKTMTERFHLQPAKSQTQRQQPQQRAAQHSSERLDRKRAAPQQPRTAGVRGQVQQAPRPKTRRDVVEEARKARGFV